MRRALQRSASLVQHSPFWLTSLVLSSSDRGFSTAKGAIMSQEVQKFENINIVGICGSLREGSLTKQALKLALTGAEQAHCSVELIDLNEYNLYFCDGLEFQSTRAKSHVPNDVAKLRAKVTAAHGLLLATPEYHNSFSGVLKNALDLMGFDEFEGKVIGLVGISGGAQGGLTALGQLREVGRALHAWVIPDQCTVPQAWKNLSDPDIQSRLMKVGKQVAKYSHLHANKQAQDFLQLFESAAVNPGGTNNPEEFTSAELKS